MNVLAEPIHILDDPYEQIVRLAISGAKDIKEQGASEAEIRNHAAPFLLACVARCGLYGAELWRVLEEIKREYALRLSHLFPPPPPKPAAATYYSFSSAGHFALTP